MSRWSVVAATASVWENARRLGSAVLVDGRHLLAAAHILRDLKESPVLRAVFPGQEGMGLPVTVVTLAATVDADVAVLDLGPEAEGLPGPVELWAGRRPPERVCAFGYPTGERAVEGVWREFAVSGPTSSGSVQLRWEEQVGTFVGHSGGPIVDRDTHRLAGILVEGSEDGRFDRFVPLTRIAEIWGDLALPWLYAGEDARHHVTRRAFGRISSADEVDLFRGRKAALIAIRDWLYSKESHGCPLVITGSPGAGKSAVLGRAAVEAEADAIIPGVVFHARGATIRGLIDAVAAACGLESPESVGALIAGIRGLVQAERWTAGVLAVLVDALDEASSGQASPIADALSDLARLKWLRVVVATRRLAVGDRYGHASLLRRLRVTADSSVSLLDLDTPDYASRDDLAALAATVLAQEGMANPGRAAATYRREVRLRARLAQMLADRAYPNYLVAAIAANTLAEGEEVVDPASPSFTPDCLPSTVGEAWADYLSGLPESFRWQQQALLTALAYARGAGISDRLWLKFAVALGYPVNRLDLDRLRRSRAADYLLESTSADNDVVVRLFHEALADQLLIDRPRGDESVVLDALLQEVEDVGGWKRHPYALRNSAEHAVKAGRIDELVSDAIFVIHADQRRLSAAIATVSSSCRTPMELVVLQDASRAEMLSADRRAEIFAIGCAQAGLLENMEQFSKFSSALLEVQWATSGGIPSQILIGHKGRVTTVAMGRLGWRDVIVSGGGDGTVRVWDQNGQPVGEPLAGPRRTWIRTVAIGRLGWRDVVVSGGGDGMIRVWNEDGHLEGEMPGAGGRALFALAVGRLGGRDVIVSGGGDGMVRVWDERCQPVGQPLEGFASWVRALAVGRLGRKDVIVSAGEDGQVLVWDHDFQPTVRSLPGHLGAVFAVAIGRLGEHDVIVSAGADHKVRVWQDDSEAPPLDVWNGEPVSVGLWEADAQSIGVPLDRHAGWVFAVQVGRLGARRLVASAGQDGTVRLWGMDGRAVGQPLTGHGRWVLGVAIGRLGERDVIVSASGDGTVRIWEPNEPRQFESLSGHRGIVFAMAAGSLEKREVVISSGQDGTVRLWSADGQSSLVVLTERNDLVFAVAVGRLGGRDVIVTAGEDGLVRLWGMDAQPVGDPLSGHTGSVRALALGPLGGRDVVISAGEDGTVRLWESGGKPVGEPLIGHSGGVLAVAVGRLGDRDVVASAGEDWTVRLWESDGRPAGEPLIGHSGRVLSVTIGRLGEQDVIVSAGEDGSVRVWNEAGEPLLMPLIGHSGEVSSVVIVRAGGQERIVSASALDGTVRVWDSGGHPLGHPLPIQVSSRATLAKSSEGITVASGSSIMGFRWREPRQPVSET